MNIFDKTKSDLLDIKLELKTSYDLFAPIFVYFNNSKDYVLRNRGDGLQIQTTETGLTTYVNSEEDDRNKFEEFISSDRSFIVKVSIWDLRLIAIEIEKGFVFCGYSLEENGFSSESIPVYKIVAANGKEQVNYKIYK